MHRLGALLILMGLIAAWAGRGEGSAVTEHKVRLPKRLHTPGLWTPEGKLTQWSEIERRFQGGDAQTRAWVARTLASADAWAARPDSYYLGLFRPETPFGSSTIACPFHPEMTGWVPFEWDPDQPWRLTCPLCTKEGRKLDYYPNPQYPDDGHGCRPTDAVWSATHDAAWSAKYHLPRDAWDGHTHGNIDGFAFNFLGYAQFRIFFELTKRRQILTTLSEAYLFATKLFPSGRPESRRAGLYAHKAKLNLLTMARAILGDAYLQDALGIDEASYRRTVQALAQGEHGQSLRFTEYPGYGERDTISDHSAADAAHPIETIPVEWWKHALTIYPSPDAGDWAGDWLPAYAMIQPSFTPAEREGKLKELVERLLTVKEGDAARLAAKGRPVKPGVVDLGLHPYEVSLEGNLAGHDALAVLNLGLMLNDHQIVRNVAAAIYRYLRSDQGGYFTTDGLGFETSPHYTQVALNNLAAPLETLAGLKEGFGPGDPFWDSRSGSLNPYVDSALEAAAYSALLSMLPNGWCAPWSDSWVTEQPQLDLAEKMANATGRVPARFLPWLDVSKDAAGKLHLRLRESPTLPSYVLGSNGLAVLRTGPGLDQTFVSVDWSRKTGHSHDGPFNLLLYDARQELLFDQGYLNNVSPTMAWMGSAEAHNTALVRAADGSPESCLDWRGGLRFFADTPGVKAVEVAQEEPAGLPAGQKGLFQRTVTLLETPGKGAEAPGAYVVDIFRLQGGSVHDYYVHSLGETVNLVGADVQPPADASLSLYDASGFTYPTDTGARAITGLSRGRNDGPFVAAWREMKDWRTVPAAVDAQMVLRVHVLAEPGTEVRLGQAPGQRYLDARDVAGHVNVLCLRRRADAYRETPDAFVAVIEARRDGAGAALGVDRLEVLSGDPAAVGVRITRTDGVDYVLSTTRDDVPTVFSDLPARRTLSLVGRLGVIRTQPGRPSARVLLRGTQLSYDEDATGRPGAE